MAVQPNAEFVAFQLPPAGGMYPIAADSLEQLRVAMAALRPHEVMVQCAAGEEAEALCHSVFSLAPKSELGK